MSGTAKLAGVLIPGDGRLRWCSTRVADVCEGDWVVVSGALGDEPGQVLFTPERISNPLSIPETFVVSRRLTSAEQARIPALIARASGLIEAAQQAVSRLDKAVEISSLRFTLDGSMLLLLVHGTAGDQVDSVSETLSRALGVPVNVEWGGLQARTFGSLGRFGAPEGERDLIMTRLRIDEVGTAQFPNGWPRLGQTVRTPHGTGQLCSVSVRHNVATVRLETGEEIEVPVDELSGLGGVEA